MITESTIIAAAIALWIAQGWYLNTRLERVHERLNVILEQFDGLREYLYEIDPQFDDERQLLDEFQRSLKAEPSFSFAGMHHTELIEEKKQRGKRT